MNSELTNNLALAAPEHQPSYEDENNDPTTILHLRRAVGGMVLASAGLTIGEPLTALAGAATSIYQMARIMGRVYAADRRDRGMIAAPVIPTGQQG
jgi:hypothetical protein